MLMNKLSLCTLVASSLGVLRELRISLLPSQIRRGRNSVVKTPDMETNSLELPCKITSLTPEKAWEMNASLEQAIGRFGVGFHKTG